MSGYSVSDKYTAKTWKKSIWLNGIGNHLCNNKKTISYSTRLQKTGYSIPGQSDDYKHKGSSTPTKTRKTSNRQIQYNVENFDKIHASSASVRNWSSQ